MQRSAEPIRFGGYLGQLLESRIVHRRDVDAEVVRPNFA
jgi:hypothetical protein